MRTEPWLSPENLVVEPQPAIAVYFTREGEIIIHRAAMDDEDSWVVMTADHAVAVARRIIELINPKLGFPPKKDQTACERQRRHRDKHRDVTAGERDEIDAASV